MTEFAHSFLVYISSTIVITGAFAWVVRKLIDNFFTHKIEQYKADLSKEHTRYQITYEKLHTERAVVIKETYKKLVSTYESFHSLMRPMQMVGEMSENEKAKIAQDFFNDFSKFFSENQIFFDKKLATKTHKLKHDLLEVWNGFLYSRDLKAGEERKQSFQEWNKAFKRLNEEIPNILTEIENDFRSIIGIE